MRGNRLVSVFVYLQLPEAGGRTAFPQLQQSFQPRAGGALLWYNLDRHGTPDERTLHAGEPVARGEKWGMNIWLRERAFPRRAWPRVSLALPLLPGGAVRAQLLLSDGAQLARLRADAGALHGVRVSVRATVATLRRRSAGLAFADLTAGGERLQAAVEGEVLCPDSPAQLSLRPGSGVRMTGTLGLSRQGLARLVEASPVEGRRSLHGGGSGPRVHPPSLPGGTGRGLLPRSAAQHPRGGP